MKNSPLDSKTISPEDFQYSIKRWFFIGLICLSIVALFGTTMRYKILYDIPFLTQKYLIHAHSHFAFSGWVTNLLFVGIFLTIRKSLSAKRRKVYHWIIGCNLFTAVGMLVWFTIQGYAGVSITFSTLSIFVVFAFTVIYIQDIRKLKTKNNAVKWALGGLSLNVISSVGPFIMAYMMATHVRNVVYMNSVIYYYLHMQYNGWFLFGCITMIVALVPRLPDFKLHFRLLLITMIPAYLLSILSLNLPVWLVWIGGISGFIQLFVWLDLVRKSYPVLKGATNTHQSISTFLFIFAASAITLKFILQSLSILPSLGHLIFGMRPIIIGYLHLVLLAGYSVFLIGYAIFKGYIVVNKGLKIGVIVFIIGVLLNEIALAIQGLGAFYYFAVPYINQFLLVAALLLFLGATSMVSSQISSVKRISFLSEKNHFQPNIESKITA